MAMGIRLAENRVDLLGDRLYVADATVPAGASEADAQRFLASIRFE
jgi:hypothetical protein